MNLLTRECIRERIQDVLSRPSAEADWL